MADLKSLSVPEILAYCRKVDGEGGSAPAAEVSEPEAQPAPPAETPAPEAAAKSAQPAKVDPSAMSVADMLAAARAEKSGGAEPPSEPAAAAPEATAKEPAAAAGPADRSKMSVADMLAAARAEKSGAAEKPAAKPAAQAKPAAKPAAKAANKPAASAAKAGPLDTSSILAAARSGAPKRGPMSKAEAAAKEQAKPAAKEKPKAPPMPPKPEYAKPAAIETKSKTDRRTMMEVLFGSMLAIGFGAMTITTTLSTLVMARFFFPNLLIEPPNQFKVGFPGDFSAGTVATKFKAQFGVWVVNADYEGQQQIAALKSVCTHLGCTPNWLEAEQKFKCPCHGSGFYKEGINFEGPAPRPLERYAIRVADDGQIEIDKSQIFQEQLGQWNDPASFVPV